MATAQVVMRRLGALNAKHARWTGLRQTADDLLEFSELAADDPELAASPERAFGLQAGYDHGSPGPPLSYIEKTSRRRLEDIQMISRR